MTTSAVQSNEKPKNAFNPNRTHERGRGKKPRANLIDAHVGKMLRTVRFMIGLSQDQIGESVGLTFQQIQKYEKGVNRISVSKLYEIARVLKTDISFFFSGLEDSNAAAEEMGFSAAESGGNFSHQAKEQSSNYDLGSKESINILRAYYNIKDKDVRKRVISLINAMQPNSDGSES